MKKLFVTAAVLLLAGVAVAGALHVKNSLSCGVCPLTGEPIHHSTPCPSTADCPYEDERCAEKAGSTAASVSVNAAAAVGDAAPAADCECPKAVKRRCCPSEKQSDEQQPVESPTQKP